MWEWQAGIRFVWGELQILANNDAADPDNPQNETSVCWKAINAADGSLVEPECTVSGSAKLSGNTVKLDYVSGKWTYSTTISSLADQSRSCLFANVTCTAAIGAATQIARLPDIRDISGAEAHVPVHMRAGVAAAEVEHTSWTCCALWWTRQSRRRIG